MDKVIDEATLKPECDIVASKANELREELLLKINNGVQELAVDLENVNMIDSVGLGVLVSAHNSLSKAGGKLTICNASNDIYGLFKAMRLDQHFTVIGCK